MCEITNLNFKEKLPEIEECLKKSKFISFDLEFSALYPVRNQIPSLFDTAEQRYNKLRRNLQQIIPLQVGLTIFQFNSDTNQYYGKVFTFYVQPVAFSTIDKTYTFQASTTKFLCLHNFDFNKFAYFGIPYMNSNDEDELRTKFNSLIDSNCSLGWEYESAIKEFLPAIEKWYLNAKIDDHIEIKEIYERYQNFDDFLYYFHKYLCEYFNNNIWTFIENHCFYIKKITKDEFHKLSINQNQHNELIDKLLGFRLIFNIIKRLRKPLIGHNLFQDLMIIYNCFEEILPKNYHKFKTKIHEYFPIIFDTKTLFYELRMIIPKNHTPTDTSLSILFDYFKNGYGSKELLKNAPIITCNLQDDDYQKYHQAGFDSYCTGYIFLHMAYLKIAPKYPETKIFVPSEILASLNQYRNCVNIIRGSTNYIRLDGEDPNTIRPPWLIVESLNNKPLNLKQLSILLSTFGSIDIQLLSSSRNQRALIAVDTTRTAKDIFKHFKNNPDLRITQYNIFKHSRFVQVCLLGGLTLTGLLLIAYSYKS